MNVLTSKTKRMGTKKLLTTMARQARAEPKTNENGELAALDSQKGERVCWRGGADSSVAFIRLRGKMCDKRTRVFKGIYTFTK